MAWDFSTEPEFAKKLDWIREFVREEVEPLEVLFPGCEFLPLNDERRKIVEQLETSDWSQTAAAEALRIPLSTLNQKIKRLNIEIRKRSAG